MPTELISVGPPTAILQNVEYALPARSVFVMASAAVEYSLNKSVWVALTGANTTGVICSAGWIRCPGGNCNIICKVQ